MSKKLILFLMVLLFGSTSFLRADEVTIGDPTSTTTNSYLPVYSLYNYSLTQQIYTADEINMSGTINDVTLWLKNSSSYARNFNIYMKEVSESEFAGATSWVSMTAADMVASGVLESGISSPVETTFTLSTPFNYSGTGNLVICFQDVTGQWSSGAASVVMDAAGNQAIYHYRDSELYNPETPGVNGTLAAKKSVLRLTIETAPVPPTPTGSVSVTPNVWALGERPLNGWMESFTARILNQGAETVVEGSMSNTSGVEPFVLSEEINQTLATDEAIDFEVAINTSAPAAEYAEEFTLFYAETRDIITVPVTATFYTAGEADIVETAKNLSLTYNGDGIAEFSHTPADLHANYFGYNQSNELDAVYELQLAKDAKVTVNGGTFIGIYNKVLNFHPTAAVEPVAMSINGNLSEAILLAGNYYMIVAGNDITTVSGVVEQIAAPEDIYAVSPADGATGLEGNIVLTWEGGANATQYMVKFGTSPVNLPVVLDWTKVDDNFGSFDVTDLVSPNTQYFWQIFAKNSNGNVNTVRRGFTTALIAPNTVTASETEIFTDGSTLIKWKLAGQGGGFTGEITVADGTETSSYIPVYGLWMDDYTRGEMIYPAEMLEEMEGGEITSLTFYISSAASGPWSGDVFNVYLMEVDNTTLSTYYTSANASIVYTGALDGQGTTMVINFDEPYTYEGGNLLVGIEETVCGTYKSCSFYGITATGASASGYSSGSLSAVTFNQRNFLPKTTFTCGGRANANTRSHLGFNIYYTNGNSTPVKVNNALITERQYLLDAVLPYNIQPGDEVAVTAVYDEGESELSTPVLVKVSGYGTFTGHVTELMSGSPVAGVNVKFTGKDEFQNNVSFETATDFNGLYTINNVKAGNYVGKATFEGMEPCNSEPVTLAYEGEEIVDFVIHEVYNPVLSVVAEEMDTELARVRWSMVEELPVPTPGGNTPGGGSGSASTFTEGFENGLPTDWTVVDGNNDGYTWCLTSAIPTTWTYYASLTLDWYRTGTNAICSGSYINGVGALTPNEYLVMGQQTIASGSTLSFWAAATDASYPADHFGVFVSDDASDWTMVNEWTLTGKSGAQGGIASRDGKGAKLGTWYNYSVDLSSYAGQKYIAIRHFNCNDQYIMVVDDIELSAGKGGTRDVAQYAVYRKAILKENELVAADSVCFGLVAAPDTLYADFGWANMEPGLYQYGVSAIYPAGVINSKGTRDEVIIGEGTATDSHVPTYNLYNYSCTNQIYTGEEIGGAGTINSIAFMPTTVNTASRNLNIYMVNSDKTSFAGASDWTPVTDADLVYSGNVNWVANEWCTVQLTNPFDFDGSNLIIVVNDLTGSWTSSNSYKVDATTGDQALYIYQDSAPYNPSAPGTGYTMAKKNQIKLDITYGGGAGGNDDPITPITWSNILPKDMKTTVVVNAIVPDESAEGTVVRFNNTFENLSFSVTLDETGTDTIADFRKGEYTVTFELLGYESSIENMPFSIWEDTDITCVFSEIFKPVNTVFASRTGYVTWDDILPADRVAQRYMVKLDGALVAETTDNYLQLEDLTVGTTYQVGVAVVYSTGMSPYTYATFTYADCSSATHQVEDLTADNTPGNTTVTLAWNGATPQPPTPTPPTGDVVVKLTAHNVWGDGTGYQMLLDNTHTLYGSTIPTSGALSTNCSGNEGIYSQFSHKIPTNADGNCSTSNMVLDGTVELTIPAGTYDWCITNPTPGDRIWIAAANGNVGGRYDDYVFEGGHTYEFTVTMYGSNDGVDVTISGGKAMYQPNMNIANSDVRVSDVVVERTIGNAGKGFGASGNAMTDDGNWYYYDNGINDDAIGLTSGGGFYWGIMLQAGQYEGNRLTKISYYDYTAHTGTVTIYQGGTSAPQTQLYSQAYSVSGTEQYIEIEMDEAVEVDNTQPLWIVMHNNNGQYVAAIDAGPGVNYGSCISTDGSTWYTTVSAASGGGLDGNWNLRAYVESGSGPAPSDLVPNKYNIFFDGQLVGATAGNTFDYDAADFAEHEYKVVWVDADYLISCEVEGENVIDYAAAPLSIDENEVINAIYPNPTSGDLHIVATAMTHISIVNAMGQVVYEQEVNANEMVIDMAKLGTGVYMVNVITENGSSVKRVTVTK
jgi:hypothetical protein